MRFGGKGGITGDFHERISLRFMVSESGSAKLAGETLKTIGESCGAAWHPTESRTESRVLMKWGFGAPAGFAEFGWRIFGAFRIAWGAYVLFPLALSPIGRVRNKTVYGMQL